MRDYEIILSKKKSLFAINLGQVRAKDKRAAEKIGRSWCDEIKRPQWKRMLSVRELEIRRERKKQLAIV